MRNKGWLVTLISVLTFTWITNTNAAGNATYRCWSYSSGSEFSIYAGGDSEKNLRVMRCTSPALVLQPDGKYKLGSEKGTYKIEGNQILLSKSKIRGAGTFQEGTRQIVFQYKYKGKQQRMTYLLQSGSMESLGAKDSSEERSTASVAPTPKIIERLDIALDFGSGDKSLDWINTVKLVPTDGATHNSESIAWLEARGSSKVITVFHEKVESGHVYTIYVGSGFDEKAVGTIDLRSVQGNVNKTINAQANW